MSSGPIELEITTSSRIVMSDVNAICAMRCGSVVNELRFRMEVRFLGNVSDDFPFSDEPWESLRLTLGQSQNTDERARACIDRRLSELSEDWRWSLDSEPYHDELIRINKRIEECYRSASRNEIQNQIHEFLAPVRAVTIELDGLCKSFLPANLHGIYRIGGLLGQLDFPMPTVEFLSWRDLHGQATAGWSDRQVPIQTHVESTRSDSTSGNVDIQNSRWFLPTLPNRNLSLIATADLRREIKSRLQERQLTESIEELRELITTEAASVVSYLGIALENRVASREGYGTVTLQGNQNEQLLGHFLRRRSCWTTKAELQRRWSDLGGRVNPTTSSITSQVAKLNNDIRILRVKVICERNTGYRLELIACDP